MEPTYKIAQRLHERRAAKGLAIYGRHLDADSQGCMIVHALEEAADQVNYLLAEIQRRREAIAILAPLADSLREVRDYGFADTVETAIEWIGGRSALAQYEEILGGGTVANSATVDPRDEALRVAAEALEQTLKLDPTCDHTDLVRLGAIWTKCEDCGKEWADDEGGFRPDPPNEIVDKIHTALAAIRAAGGQR